MPTNQIGRIVSGTEFAGVVILSADNSGANRLNKGFFPLWEPSPNDALKALDQLPDFLRQATTNDANGKTLAELRKGIPETVCQVVGIKFEGERAILFNCLPNGHWLAEGWQNHYIKVYDGGNRFWSIVYLTEEQRFIHFYIGLGL